jgi:predicted hydrocarbon binding protein
MQYTMRAVLSDRYGEPVCRQLFRDAGKLAGMAFCNQFLDTTQTVDAFIAQLDRELINHHIGILRIEKADLDNLHLVLTISEDLDCSGLPINGSTVCDYDEGFIAGILEVYLKKEFDVREVDCWATGDRTCRFEVNKK